MQLRVLVIQDHPLLGSTIASILEAEEDMSVCGIARTGADALAIATREKPHVVLMDVRMPDMTGAAVAAAIRARIPGVAIVFHSAEDSETALLDAIDAGATAFLARSATTSSQIVDAVRRAARGEWLIPVSVVGKALARRKTRGQGD